MQTVRITKMFRNQKRVFIRWTKKRLAIALELVNNPPVIFLDEPTTGLDNYAIKQCMDLLYDISKEGRTVVCTIHQPPTSLFQKFDQVFILAKGLCVYSGSPSELVPFLSNAQMFCPKSHTPVDYLIDIVQQNPETINIFASNTENGKANSKRKAITPNRTRESKNIYEIYQETTQMGLSDMSVEFPVSFWKQFVILLSRIFLQMRRNKSMLYIQFFHHLISALLVGGIFFGVGNNATQIPAIFKFCICATVFFIYTYLMTPVLLFPLEIKLLRREYFNRWYSLKAYYMAITVSGLPLLILFGAMFLVIIYFFTDQPMEMERFVLFVAMGIAVALCSQGLGYIIGTLCSILKGSIVGPSAIAFLLALAVYGMGYNDGIEPYMKFIMKFSYVRYGLVGFCSSIFNERAPLECTDEIYCHYNNPSDLMKEMGMNGSQYQNQIIGVVIFIFIFRVGAYAALKYRMSSEFSTRIAYYATKIINPKEC
ncbi:hypothetical protein HHI36_010798 [Cryptolaemus montrouzieri]|uniref:Uncharacterized protein n=1 Tax=Cryptolaemus montrouzieri TaxID=559131 RepID=A0ABD2MK06_9CUCU